MSESSLQGGRRQKEAQEVGGAVGDESFASSWPAEKQRCLKWWKGSSKPPSTIQCGLQPGSNQEQVGGLFQVDGANGVGASAVLDPCGDDRKQLFLFLGKEAEGNCCPQDAIARLVE